MNKVVKNTNSKLILKILVVIYTTSILAISGCQGPANHIVKGGYYLNSSQMDEAILEFTYAID